MERKTKRTPPSTLVGRSVPQPYKRVSWYDMLPADDQLYVKSVAAEMKNRPMVAPYLVADALIAELNLTQNRHTVVRTLKGMLQHA